MRQSLPRRQRGIVLLISLIVLVAMTLAGIGLMRSVDSSVVVAGNLAFKEAAVQAADRGSQEAAKWLANSATGTLQNTNDAVGYFSARFLPEPDWFDIANWDRSVVLNGGAPDAAGNVVRYVIHRMCTQPDEPYNGANECGLYFPVSGAASGGSMAVGAPQFIGSPQLYYRVTTRVDGPRNTLSVVQTSVLGSI